MQFGPIVVVMATSEFDGMCRPNRYNAFVFRGIEFAGTLAPELMMARTDGSIQSVDLPSRKGIWIRYMRYDESDAMCCPSRTTDVWFGVEKTHGKPLVVVTEIYNQPPDSDVKP